MNAHEAVVFGQQALQLAALVSAPLLLAALIVGLAVSVVQAATQINEQTLSFIPKLLAVFGTLVAAGPWMLTLLTDYFQRVLTSVAHVVG